MIEDAPLWRAIVTVDEADIAKIAIFGQRAANDKLEILLPVIAVADVAAIQTDDDTPVWNGQVHPVAWAGILHEGASFFRQLPLYATGGAQLMLPDRRGIGLALQSIGSTSASSSAAAE